MQTNVPKTYSIVAVIVILACLALGYYVFTSLYPAYTAANNSLVVAKDNNAQLNQALASVQSFLESFEQQKPNTGKVGLALPSGNADMPNFIASLSQLALSSGVALSNFQTTYPAGSEISTSAHSIQTQQISFTATSSYPSFNYFLGTLQDHLRLIDIYHVNLTSSNQDNSLLQYQVKLRTYYQQ